MVNTENRRSGVMYITLKKYLSILENTERTKPENERREVPSIVALAKAIGIHPMTLSDIANNNITRFNLDTGAAIIDEMRRRGFTMEASDLIDYRPADLAREE